jgi:Uroporphyrinogen decarboxylase (URO-D)
MKAHERLWKAIQHEEADRVPTFSQHIESPFLQRYDEIYEIQDDYGMLVPELACAKELGLDSKWHHSSSIKISEDNRPDIPPEILKKFEGKFIGNEGSVSERGDDGTWYIDGVLKTPELIKEWISFIKTFEPGSESHWKSIGKIWKAGLETDMVPIPTAGGPTYTSWSSIGLNRLAYITRKYPQLFKDLHSAWCDVAIMQHTCLFEQGIDMVFICDDHCYKDRCMFSPTQFQEFFVDNFKRITKNAEKYGAKVFMHSDGDLTMEIPYLIDAGFAAAEPLEYEAGNRLENLKEKYGDKITLIGNVAASDVLSYGTLDETIALTKKCMKDAAEGGGYILAPGSDVLGTIKIENFKAMIATVKKYGNYPLDKSKL